MTRGDSDALLAEYDDAAREYRILIRMRSPESGVAFAKMNACRERVLDALAGEESTQPLAGRAS